MAIKLMPCYTRDSHTHPLPARQARRREHSNPFRQVATSVPQQHGQQAPSTTVRLLSRAFTEPAAKSPSYNQCRMIAAVARSNGGDSILSQT
jgi:hypothetical protein